MIFKSKNKNVQQKITVNIADQNIENKSIIYTHLSRFLFSSFSCHAILFAYLSLSRLSHFLAYLKRGTGYISCRSFVLSQSRAKVSAGLTI